MKGFAYLISVFKEPERVVRLVNRIATKKDYVYIHIDKKVGKQKIASWQEYLVGKLAEVNLKIAATTVVNWGSFGLTESTLIAMKYFGDLDYSYFINLSGDCYPLKSKEEIRDKLANKNEGYIRYWKMPYDGWYKGGMNRIHNNYFPIPLRYPKYPFVKIIKLPRIHKSLPYGLQPYGGTNWFCLPKEQTNYLLQFIEQNPKIIKFYKTAFAPAEMFFATIMLNSPFKQRIINDDMRLINWAESSKRGNPGVYTIRHYEELMKSDKLFARKFNPKTDAKILDLIDQNFLKIT